MPSLSTLDPRLRPWAEEMLTLARSIDRRFVVTSARRTYAEQWRLWWNRQWNFSSFGMGQETYGKEKKDLPVAFPGHSAHEKGLAWDMARIGVEPLQDDLLRTLGAVWKAVGGKWNIVDPVHFEMLG